MHILETNELLKERHGYDIGFFNRYDLLCVLHRHIREKERLLVKEKVVRIDNYDDKVVVQTAAGHAFEAQVIVGADGVRSGVRKEMWRNAEAVGAVPEEDKKGQSRQVGVHHLATFPPPPNLIHSLLTRASQKSSVTGPPATVCLRTELHFRKVKLAVS